MKRNWWILPTLLLALSLIAYGRSNTATSHSCDRTITVNTNELCVEVVSEQDEIIKGLSGRKSLAENTGMLFEFEQPALHGIWMKDMNFSLDIIWLDSEGKITFIEEAVSPDTYPKVFRPFIPSNYVLETNTGFVEAHSLQPGDLLATVPRGNISTAE